MNDQLAQVFAFMSKHGQPLGVPIRESSSTATFMLTVAGDRVLNAATMLRSVAEELHKVGTPDIRIERAQLVIEEAGELAIALSKQDGVQVADAIADLLYVVLGAALAFSIPIQECFEEVHRSNMTKTPTRAQGDTLLKQKSKGPDFSPAKLEPILRNFGLLPRIEE